MTSTNQSPRAGLLNVTQNALGKNLARALKVAKQDENTKRPRNLTHAALAKKTGIARSTIAKLLTGREEVNPDLRTLCRIAEQLNVPPAYLLMTINDWQRLSSGMAGAFSYLLSSEDGADKARRRLHECGESEIALAELGLEIAIINGVYKDYLARMDSPEIQDQQKIAQMGIKTATSMPNWYEISDDSKTLLFIACALIGAATNLRDEK